MSKETKYIVVKPRMIKLELIKQCPLKAPTLSEKAIKLLRESENKKQG